MHKVLHLSINIITCAKFIGDGAWYSATRKSASQQVCKSEVIPDARLSVYNCPNLFA
ncbi:MAG: hypothetical protein SWX82_21540 [Cyanobacteriota bacterium]|nr:hypothetical protein [Cyanobacteriota bacterium]